MRSLLPLVPLLVVAVAPSCSIMWGNDHKATLTQEVGFDAGGVQHIEIHSYNGTIEVVAAEGDQVSGNTELYARASSPEAALERVNSMTWVGESDGDTLVIEIEGPTDGKKNYGASLAIAVPEGVTLLLKSGNGRLRVEGDYPTMNLHTSNGRITVKSDGELRARTSNGRIEYTGASADFNLKTSNGRVVANLVGDWSGSGEIDTSNGKVVVNCSGTLGAAVDASTSNGKLYSEGPREEGPGALEIESSNGSIYVRSMVDLAKLEGGEKAAAEATATQG